MNQSLNAGGAKPKAMMITVRPILIQNKIGDETSYHLSESHLQLKHCID